MPDSTDPKPSNPDTISVILEGEKDTEQEKQKTVLCMGSESFRWKMKFPNFEEIERYGTVSGRCFSNEPNISNKPQSGITCSVGDK